MKVFYYAPLLYTLMILLSIGHSGYAVSASSPLSNKITSFEEEISEIIKVIPFNNTNPSSITVDPVSNLVYVSVRPDYSYDYLSQLCSGQYTVPSNNESSSIYPCSVIYVLDGETDKIIDIIRLRSGEEIHNMDIDPRMGRIYATGEYNYRADDSEGNGEQIQYEDDVVYIISNINYSSKDNTRAYSDTNNTERITLYREIEEGKEGDMSDIAVDTNTNTIYAGIRYFQGGREGIFIIPNNSQIDSKLNGTDNNNYLSNTIKFIPLGNTGPEQILVNDQMNTIYVLLEHDDSIAIIDGSNKMIKEEIILQNPRAISINPTTGLGYVASGESHWFNIIDMNTNKAIAANTQISYPIASAVDNITGKVYVAECLDCDNFDFTNGTSIYELASDGSTITWNTYENISIEENGLATNPFTSKLYAIGTDARSEISNLYIIDIS